jgi:hypothetical protein
LTNKVLSIAFLHCRLGNTQEAEDFLWDLIAQKDRVEDIVTAK